MFTAAEARTLTALCEQIIPGDEDPGAAWAGVVKYIDRQLSRRFRGQIEVYRKGIAFADELAGGDFASATTDRQSEVIGRLQRHARPFFDQLLAHTMQGFYGNPRHGGNREFASWTMLGIPPLPVRGRQL